MQVESDWIQNCLFRGRNDTHEPGEVTVIVFPAEVVVTSEPEPASALFEPPAFVPLEPELEEEPDEPLLPPELLLLPTVEPVVDPVVAVPVPVSSSLPLVTTA